jgi:DNA-binding MarR family transcriptional regulator
MVDRTSAGVGNPSTGGLSAAALETSRLMVELLHAAYATRRLDLDDNRDADAAAGEPGRTHGTASVDVSTHAVRAAIHVYQHGERTVGQLASGLGISYGWASRVVEELETAGYVIRERDANDRRVVRVRLNPEKLAEVERAYEWRGRAVEEALEPLSESGQEAVRLFLRRVTDLLLVDQPKRP